MYKIIRNLDPKVYILNVSSQSFINIKIGIFLPVLSRTIILVLGDIYAKGELVFLYSLSPYNNTRSPITESEHLTLILSDVFTF